ncbi:MAG: pentapeptide repeat-containing protein [Planctomycetes bacterium]|nr:pentapeptide repeat-containing protein [Planctomycetota bacterium]
MFGEYKIKAARRQRHKTHRKTLLTRVWKLFVLVFWKFLFVWLLWDKTGVRFICRKFQPEKESVTSNPVYARPATFVLWTIGIYVALFGIASSRYELSLSRAESKLNTIVAQLGTSKKKVFRNLIDQVPVLQKSMTPLKPKIFHPISVVMSLVFEENSTDIRNRSIKVLAVWKDELTNVAFKEANLTKAEFEGADLTGANLTNATLRGANLTGANLTNATLRGANLINATLRDTTLTGATLTNATLEGANLTGANLTDATLRGVNLINARLARANIYRVQAPEGLIIQALTQGAVELASSEWLVFKDKASE